MKAGPAQGLAAIRVDSCKAYQFVEGDRFFDFRHAQERGGVASFGGHSLSCGRATVLESLPQGGGVSQGKTKIYFWFRDDRSACCRLSGSPLLYCAQAR